MVTTATASLLVQPFPVGRWGKNPFLEPPSILAVTHLGYVVTHLCFPLRPPCLPVNCSGWSLSSRNFSWTPWRDAGQRHMEPSHTPSSDSHTLPLLLLCSTGQEHHKRGLSSLTPSMMTPCVWGLITRAPVTKRLHTLPLPCLLPVPLYLSSYSSWGCIFLMQQMGSMYPLLHLQKF